MYRKGELQVTVPPCAEMLADPNGECFSDDHKHSLISLPLGQPPTAFLPHSCNEWIVGGKEQVQELIDDLLAVFATMP